MSTKTPKELIDTVLIDTKDKSMPNQKDITIFLVDDDPIYLKSLELQFLQNPVLKIRSFLSGEACLEQMAIKPDIIILDYKLNGSNLDAMDGAHALVAIKNMSPGTQVIMLSSAEDVEVVTGSLKKKN